MKWFVGIQTSPRRRPLLEQSLASLRKAGWSQFVIFAEPGSPRPQGKDLSIRPAVNYLGIYANWRRMIAEAAKTIADRCMFCQDDIIVWASLKEILEKEIPDKGFAVYAPFTVIADHRAAGDPQGWFETDRNYYVNGAWLYAMNRDMAVEMNQLMPPSVPNNRAIDSQVGLLMSLAGHPLYLHYPSMLSHCGGELSAMGYEPTDRIRETRDFIGESSTNEANSEPLVPETDYDFLENEDKG